MVSQTEHSLVHGMVSFEVLIECSFITQRGRAQTSVRSMKISEGRKGCMKKKERKKGHSEIKSAHDCFVFFLAISL